MAAQAARDCYELHDPANQRFSERDENPYLRRAWPSFDALWADGEWARWTDRLLRPLHDVLDRQAEKPAARTSAEGAST